MPTIIDLPAIAGWEDIEFDPVSVRYTDRMEGRRTESVAAGSHWWRARYVAAFQSDRDFGLMDAFMMRAGDSGEVFRAHDVFRPRPIEWSRQHGNQPLSGPRAAGGTFDGTATITARTATSLIVSGLPANFQFRAGDYVEVRKGPSLISLHRITQDAQATSAGTVTLAIRHTLDTGIFTLPLTANFEKASCLMQIDPGSWSGSKSWGARRPSFTAQEVFLP